MCVCTAAENATATNEMLHTNAQQQIPRGWIRERGKKNYMITKTRPLLLLLVQPGHRDCTRVDLRSRFLDTPWSLFNNIRNCVVPMTSSLEHKLRFPYNIKYPRTLHSVGQLAQSPVSVVVQEVSSTSVSGPELFLTLLATDVCAIWSAPSQPCFGWFRSSSTSFVFTKTVYLNLFSATAVPSQRLVSFWLRLTKRMMMSRRLFWLSFVQVWCRRHGSSGSHHECCS